VGHLSLDKPAMNLAFWQDFHSKVTSIHDSAFRCVVLSSACKAFSFGLDLKDEAQKTILMENNNKDPARKAHELFGFLSRAQASFSALEALPQPVVACVHSHCVGGAMDLVCFYGIVYSCNKCLDFMIPFWCPFCRNCFVNPLIL
jgi:enoyl-CoA hydratase/carnithine racemase